jgi:hypothetical protein
MFGKCGFVDVGGSNAHQWKLKGTWKSASWNALAVLASAQS